MRGQFPSAPNSDNWQDLVLDTDRSGDSLYGPSCKNSRYKSGLSHLVVGVAFGVLCGKVMPQAQCG
jgi:hypothetical protein